MTRPSALARPRLRLPVALAAVALAAFAAFAAPSRAGWDDFEFGQRLVDKGYIEYARRVFEGILNDASRPAADKERAKFGMALLGTAELRAAMASSKFKYAEIGPKFKAAVDQIRDFVAKNGSDPKADEARFKIGEISLWFVDRANALATGPKEDLDAREAKVDDVLADAQKAVDTALQTFETLKQGARKDSDKKLAEYFAVTALYFKGLVHPKCSAAAVNAFLDAKARLDDYITLNDGRLFAAYAQDNLGRVFAELADCESDGDKKDKLYRDALQQFIACADTPDESAEHRALVALGYLHAGELANHAGNASDTKGVVYLTTVAKLFSTMATQKPGAMKEANGVLALVEWAYVESKLDHVDQAITIAKKASDLADEIGSDWARRKANEALTAIVRGGSAGTASASAAVDATVFLKIGLDLKQKGKYQEAIGAFQKAIAASGPTPTTKALIEVVLPAWQGTGDSYRSMEPPLWLEAATAYDAVADAVRGGRIQLVGDNDPPSRMAFLAVEAERAALKRLGDETGDPTIRDRIKKFDQWQIEAFRGYQSQGGIPDREYGQAISFWNDAIKEKTETDEKGPNWRRVLGDARTAFENVSKNSKSEWQDNAWTYRVRVPYELGDYAGAVEAADAALAWWASPEGQKPLAVQGAATKRKAQTAATTYWKASALFQQKKYPDVLGLLDGFVKAFGADAGEYRGRSLGLRVETLLTQGENAKAEDALKDLVKEAPDYYGMPRILLKLASSYQATYDDLQKKVAELNVRLFGKPDDRQAGLTYQIRALQKHQADLFNILSSLAQLINRKEIELAQGNEDVRKLAEEELKKLRPEYANAQKDSAETKTKIAALQAESVKIGDERTAVRQQQIAPLRKTADLYRRLDDALKDLDAKRAPGEKPKRVPGSVANLANRFYILATIDPEAEDAWIAARDLFEDYLALPEIKAAGDAEARRYYAVLGDVYDHLTERALAAKKTDEARDTAAKAAHYLEAAIAKNPANAQMLVDHLAGNLPVLDYPDAITGKTWRVPVHKVDDVPAFVAQIKGLTDDKLPRYQRDETQQEYQRVVGRLRREVDGYSDAKLRSIVSGMKVSGFNVTFFVEHGETRNDFLLSLGHAYLRSGAADATVKAMNVARVLLGKPEHEEDESPVWWDAKTIQLAALVSAAERELKSGGGDSPTAKAYAKDADALLSTTKKITPHIGGNDPDSRKTTLATWHALQQRLQAVALAVGVTSSAVDLDVDPEAVVEAPTPETPAPPAPAGGPPGGTPPPPAPPSGSPNGKAPGATK